MSVRYDAVLQRLRGKSTFAGPAFDIRIPDLECARFLVGERDLAWAAADMIAASLAADNNEALLVVAFPPQRRRRCLHVDVHSPRDFGIQHNYFRADDQHHEEQAAQFAEFLTALPQGAVVKAIPARWDWRAYPGALVRLGGGKEFGVFPGKPCR